MQECPVCTEMFPIDLIEVHSSSCVERYLFTFSCQCFSLISNSYIQYQLNTNDSMWIGQEKR